MMRFSTDEISRFQVRFEEGYDLPDQRYEQWAQMHHPESTTLHGPSTLPAEPDVSMPLPSTPKRDGDSCSTLPRSSVLAHLLADKAPTVKYPQPHQTSCGRVLTSSENLLLLLEKERRKKEEADEKQRRKEEREQKRLEVQETKRKKVLERERKRLEKNKRVSATTKGRGAGSARKGMHLLV